MNPRALKTALKEAGFWEERPVRHGHFWTDGKYRFLVPRSHHSDDPRSYRNNFKKLDRIVELKRTGGTALPQGHGLREIAPRGAA